MRLGVLLLLSGLLLAAGPMAGLSAAEKAPDPAQLVDRLGSPEFPERQDAMRALDALGEPALTALKAGLRSSDMEIRRRCEELVDKIERRLESARILAAKRIQLSYKDTPLADAIADFGRKAGFPLELGGNAAKLNGRKITLETGSVTFWEALDQFCDKAGLVEITLAQPAAAPGPGTPEDEVMRIKQLQQQALIVRGGMPYNPYPQPTDPSKIVLVDGKLPALPSFRSSALRVRLLPSHVPVSSLPGGNGEKTLPLEVTPEPGLSWLGLVSIRVHKAVDEHGQALVQPSLYLSQALDLISTPYGPVFVNGGAVYYGGYPQPMMPNPNHAPIRLKPGERPAKLIKELEGTATCQVQTPPEALITVDNILKAAGTTAEGVDGGSIKVVEAKREANGQVRLKVMVQPPGQDIPDPMLGGFAGRAVRINRAVFAMKGMAAPAVNPGSLELRDDKGTAIPLISSAVGQQQIFPGGFGLAEQELVFQPNPGQGAPAKLVYVGRRRVTVEAPFTLKDVPLP